MQHDLESESNKTTLPLLDGLLKCGWIVFVKWIEIEIEVCYFLSCKMYGDVM